MLVPNARDSIWNCVTNGTVAFDEVFEIVKIWEPLIKVKIQTLISCTQKYLCPILDDSINNFYDEIFILMIKHLPILKHLKANLT